MYIHVQDLHRISNVIHRQPSAVPPTTNQATPIPGHAHLRPHPSQSSLHTLVVKQRLVAVIITTATSDRWFPASEQDKLLNLYEAEDMAITE